MSRCKVLPRTVRLSATFLKQTMCFRRKVRDARLSRSLLNGATGCQLQQVARRDDARQVQPRKYVRHFSLPPTSSEGHRRQRPSPASRRSWTSRRTSCFTRFPRHVVQLCRTPLGSSAHSCREESSSAWWFGTVPANWSCLTESRRQG